MSESKAADTTGSSESSAKSKLFNQDIVQILAFPEQLGVVLRCWHDAEDAPPIIPPTDPLMRPLSYGEVGVTFLSRDCAGRREIFHERDLQLVDRILQPGDYCKRSIDDVQSGVVLNFRTKARIVHAISGEEIEGWFTREDMEDRVYADTGDYVMYDDWIGQIIEVFDESLVERANGHLLRLRELGGRMAVGQKGTDLTDPYLHDPMCPSAVRRTSKGIETVLDVKHNVFAVAWLALNQSLDPAVAETKSRPKRFWFGEDLSELMLITDRVDLEIRVGDIVKLKNKEGVPVTRHGTEGADPGPMEVDALLVTRTESHVDVLWQDGTRETARSVDLIPYLNPDEYDCWPGDQLIWKNEDEISPAIVQSVNAVDRTAQILLPESGKIELAPVLELDAHGTSGGNAENDTPSESLGVRVGDFVFIHAAGTDNGLTPPRVPRIGELEPWVREHPFTDGKFGGWRKEMQVIGAMLPRNRPMKFKQQRASLEKRLAWCGEVTELCCDGTVKVTHADTTTGVYPLNRLTRLYDGIEQLEDDAFDAGSEVYSDDETERMWAMDEDGNWTEQAQDGDWEDVGSDNGSAHGHEHDHDHYDDDVEMTDDAEQDDDSEDDSEDEFMEVEEHLWADEEPVAQPPSVDAQPALTEPVVQNGSATPTPPAVEKEAAASADAEETSNFEIIPSAPPDHAFFSTPPGQPSKQFLGRLSKEYRVLRSSLPDSIIVRAFEDRTDLLRCMIIGPENTPYQDAPFVIDWLLDSNFPNSPPKAHFLSWTNGNGRVNPNLYEEGKVCLSILGTWSGDKNEIWSAARSSLLQAFVSIQGLVLVKEPWFCEPAYEKLRGTKEGTVNSRLYSEKAYVLSRGFVRRALEIPLGGLEDEVKNLYYKNGLLQRVLTDAEQLIDKSKQEAQPDTDDSDLAVPRLTGGGIITLERTLAKLRTLLQNYTSTA